MRPMFAIATFVAAILAANYATSTWGMVPVGFGLVATAGTLLAGLSFVLRDWVQDLLGWPAAVGAVAVGAALSYALADPFIALASGVAFLLSELVDLAIYTPLRKRGYLRAAVTSNVAGAFVDTIAFLWIAGFPIWSSVPGQMVGKFAATGVVILAVAAVRVRPLCAI